VNVVIDAARDYGDLTTEQQERLDVIALEVEENRESWRALHDKFKNSAVSVVRAGSTDSEEFNQAITEAVQAVEEHVARGSNALEEIHGILEPDQRASVAEALRAHIDEKFGRPKQERDLREQDGFKRFAAHLMLTTFQVDQLMAVKKELVGNTRGLRPTREELYALVDAFEGEDFRAALDAFHAKKQRIFKNRIASAGEKTDTVLAIFTPEQRDLIADLILEGPRKVLLGEEAPTAEEAPAAE